MKTGRYIVVVIAMLTAARAQSLSGLELARALSDDATRKAAVADIVAAERGRVPLLLSWANTPPKGVSRIGLNIGMAMVFGSLKVKAAIPFLIKYITLPAGIPTPPWMKTTEVIVDRLPALSALIQIGPDAAEAIMNVGWEHLGAYDRLASLILVSRVGEGQAARDFINRALGEANLQREFATEALRTLEGRASPAK